MYKVLGKLRIGNKYGISLEGDSGLLKKGLELIDEKGNVYEIETIGMTHYKNVEDFHKYAEVMLCGNVENIGETLFLNE